MTPRARLALALKGLLLAGACATTPLDGCLDPPTTDSADAQGVISGTVFYDGPTPLAGNAAAGNVLVFVYAETNPPPPQGQGRPVTFAVVTRDQLFPAGTEHDGFHSAPLAIPQVPPGRYVLRALLDVNGDFDPFVLVRASASRGDVGGGAVDPRVTPAAFQVVEVKGGRETVGVTVTLSAAAATVLADAPAVELGAATRTISSAATVPTRLRLAAWQVGPDAVAIERSGLPGARLPGLALELRDEDGDGVGEDADGDGLVDVFPRVVLRRLDDSDPRALRDDPDATTIPCQVDPTPVLDALKAAGGTPNPAVWVEAVDVLCLPVAVDVRVSPALVLPRVPAGRYAVLLVSRVGQVWRLPNEYGPAADPVGRRLLDAAMPSQGAHVTVTDDTLPGGCLGGTVRLVTQPTGNAWLFAYQEADPPPPLGAGRPVASTRVPPETFTDLGASFESPYTIGGLPPGRYTLAVLLDQDRNFDLRVEAFSQATQGDWRGNSTTAVSVADAESQLDVSADVQVLSDPPFFARPGGNTITLSGGTLRLSLAAEPMANPLVTTGRPPALQVSWRTNGNAPADGDGDGLPDVWPRAILQRVAVARGDSSGVGGDRRVVLAAAVDPATVGMALGNTLGPPVTTSSVTLVLAAQAVDATDANQPVPLPAVPAGTYALTLVDRSGQFARPPSVEPALLPRGMVTLAEPFPEAMAPQLNTLLVEAGTAAAVTGSIRGTLKLPTGTAVASAFVLVTDPARPGPPDGAGLPIAVARVGMEMFTAVGAEQHAAYEVRNIPVGSWRVQALLDTDANFSLLSGTRALATRGDVLGRHPGVVVVAADPVLNVDVVLGSVVPFGPPVFEPRTARVTLAGLAPLQLSVPLDAAPALSTGGPVDLDPATLGFAVTLRDADTDGNPDDVDADGVPDLYPRVLLRSADGARVVPAVLDPSRYLPPLLAGAASVATGDLHALVLPVAVDTSGARVTPVAGAHGVVSMTVAGQAWSVPNDLSPAVANAGGGVPSQGRTVEVLVAPAAGTGGISGTLVVPAAACGPVIVLARAFDATLATAVDAPAAASVFPPSVDASGTCVEPPAEYALRGLAPGTYAVQAFLDADNDFHPLLMTRAGPSAGDLAGGHVAAGGGALQPILVGDAEVPDVPVTISTTLALDMPAFRFEDGWPTSASILDGPVRTAFTVTGTMDSPLAHVDMLSNAFTTTTTASATYPLVVLARLDDDDPRGLALAQPLELVVGDVDESAFTGATAARVEVVFTPQRVDGAMRPVGPATPGRYAVVVVNADGSKWRVPNELDPARVISGSGFANSAGQGAAWAWR